MRMVFFGVLFFVSSLFAASINESIVKVYATINDYDYSAPWSPPSTYKAIGSGCIINGNLIITNAHVVANASFIEICSATSKEHYEATVKVIGHDCDLALLEVEDPSFFRGKKALEFLEGVIPQETEVQVYGFPIGGTTLSVTKGIVSRIEIGHYAYSGASLLLSQIDAPINPGNSGGPVVADGKIVGIAHQIMLDGQNIGYMIPLPVIEHFLKEAGNGEYHGFPGESFKYQLIHNPTMRSYYGLEKDQGGLIVLEIPSNHFLYDHLKPGDILLSIDGHLIDSQGMIHQEEMNIFLPFQYLIMMKHFGDEISLTIIREDKEIAIRALIDPNHKGLPLVEKCEFDKAPSYFVYGGFVFQPLVGNILNRDLEGSPESTVIDLIYCYIKGKVEEGRNEIVVLTRVLDDALTRGYQHLEQSIIEDVNGRKVKSLKDFVSTIESLEDPYVIIHTRDQVEIILDRQEVMQRNRKILMRYFIPKDRSEDLR